jgi:hypothetical protein
MSDGLIIQSGADRLRGSRDPKLGIIAAQLKCWAPDVPTALFTPAPDIGLGIPEWNPRQWNSRPGGEQEGYDVVISYEGHSDPDNATGESYEIEGSTTDDPIETHWNFEVLLKNYKGKEDANGRAKWPKTLTDAEGKKGRNKMHGVESWAAPGLIWNHNWTSRILPASLIDILGVISQPPGNPPALSGDRDWLCIRIRGAQRGNIWQLQDSWQLSGPGGSVPEMYQRA